MLECVAEFRLECVCVCGGGGGGGGHVCEYVCACIRALCYYALLSVRIFHSILASALHFKL